MKNALNYALLLGSLLLAACQADEAPSPAAPLTATDSLKLILSGHWESTDVTNAFYTDDKLETQETLGGAEKYMFGQDGAFALQQEAFFIRGRWNLSRHGDQVTVATSEGELMQWRIETLSDTKLVLHSAQTTIAGARAHRLETTVSCQRAAE